MDFFVPFANSPEQAEKVYRAFAKVNERFGMYHLESRLYAVTFLRHGRQFRAIVGRELADWSYPQGPVLAIIETRGPICIHTRLQGGISSTAIYVSVGSVSERLYFDDFPALNVSGEQGS